MDIATIFPILIVVDIGPWKSRLAILCNLPCLKYARNKLKYKLSQHKSTFSEIPKFTACSSDTGEKAPGSAGSEGPHSTSTELSKGWLRNQLSFAGTPHNTALPAPPPKVR